MKASLRRAARGLEGLWPWAAVHIAAYFVTLSVVLAAWTIAWNSPNDVLWSWIVALLYALVTALIPTFLVTLLIWPLRGLGWPAFRAVAVILCCLQFVCTPSLDQLMIIAPVQVLYGLLIVKPRETPEDDLSSPV